MLGLKDALNVKINQLKTKAIEIKPQEGLQVDFLKSTADIVLGGGGAGGGKSFGLLMEASRNIHNPKYQALIFRRTCKQIEAPGSLWDTAGEIYPGMGGKPVGLEYRFPSGSVISFNHLEHEKNKYDYMGAQIPMLGFDELTHFSWGQTTYLWTRNRSMCGVRPYIRATCNPDPDHWLRFFIDWWIGNDGFPIKDRSGRIRFFVIKNDEVIWGDTRESLEKKYHKCEPKSFTFIPALLSDNKILLNGDPGYRANLLAQPEHIQQQLLHGNWNARARAGSFFRREMFEIVDVLPNNIIDRVRAWDFAGTTGGGDWTAGVRMSKTSSGVIIIEDVVRSQIDTSKILSLIQHIASQDGKKTKIRIPQDPGQAGKSQVQSIITGLSGYSISSKPVTGSKTSRATPLSSQASAGNVIILRGDWDETFIREMVSFTGSDKNTDDQVDAASDAFDALVSQFYAGTF